MEATGIITFEKNGFAKRLKSMLAVDFRRMFTTKFFYIMVGICFVMPILILVMTTMMDGSVTKNPQTGVETVIEGFDNVWQVIATRSDTGMGMSMDLTGMCNINMLYFIIAVLVTVFISDDFRSGYSKNLFAVRAKKSDYVISKTLICFVGGACMLLAFIVGAMLGGSIAGLPFDLGATSSGEVAMCMLGKVLLAGAFVPLYVLWSVVGKEKLWLSMVGSFGTGMLLYTMAPMITPLNSSIVNVALCLIVGIVLSVGLGAVSNLILNKTSLV